jgi:hypothetical protein
MRRRAIGIGFWAATLALAPAAARAAEDERVLDRHAAADGSVLTVSVLKGTHLAVRREGGGGLQLQAQPIADLFPNEEVVAAKAAPRAGGDVLLAIATRRGTGNSYRWLTTTGGKDGAWKVSEPILADVGEPLRIVEVRNPRGDDVEITLRRATADPLGSKVPFEEYVYVLAGGVGRLYSARPLETTTPRGRAGPSDLEDVPFPEEKPVVDVPAEEVPEDAEIVLGEPRPVPHVDEPEPSPPILVTLDIGEDGALVLRSPEGTESRLGSLQSGDAVAREVALRSLEEALVKVVADPARRQADGSAKVRLVLRPSPKAAWRSIQWSLMAAADRAKIFRVRLGEGNGALDLDLPRDRGLRSAIGPPPGPQGRVPEPASLSLFPVADMTSSARTRLRLPGTTSRDVDFAAGDDRGVDALAAAIREWIPPKVPVVMVRTPPPKGGDIPYADVLAVLRALRAAGATDIHLEGAPSPTSRRARR